MYIFYFFASKISGGGGNCPCPPCPPPPPLRTALCVIIAFRERKVFLTGIEV